MTQTALVIADKLPDGMPPAADVIDWMRGRLAHHQPAEVLAGASAEWPTLEQVAPVSVLAEWFGMREQSIYMARSRKRPDGSPVWPEPDAKVGKTSLWRFSTAALGRATAPGKGWRLRGEVREGAK